MKTYKTLFIVGPTASGKSFLAETLCKKFSLIPVSMDSMQIYKGMDIGTGKPLPDTVKTLSYKGIDLLFPDSCFSAGDYYRYAEALIRGNHRESFVFVGGTGLYFNSLYHGIDILPEKNGSIREKYKSLAREKGIAYLYNLLAGKDPGYAGKISENDEKRIVRALEVFDLTGKPFSSHHSTGMNSRKTASALFEPENTVVIGLQPEKDFLDQLICTRIDKMFDEGWFEESLELYFQYPVHEYPAFKAIGYSHIFSYITYLLWLHYPHCFEKNKNLESFISGLSQNRQKIWQFFLSDPGNFRLTPTNSRDFLKIFSGIDLLYQGMPVKSINSETNDKIHHIYEQLLVKSLQFDQIIKRIKFDTIQFAKRQLTWFRKNPDIIWITDFTGDEESLKSGLELIEGKIM